MRAIMMSRATALYQISTYSVCTCIIQQIFTKSREKKNIQFICQRDFSTRDKSSFSLLDFRGDETCADKEKEKKKFIKRHSVGCS